MDSIPNQCVSNTFTRPRRSGGLRTIINLKQLNRYFKKIHFKMEHIMTIFPLIKRDMCMTSLDLKDAYFSLPIAKASRKYLRFLWQGQVYEYQCLFRAEPLTVLFYLQKKIQRKLLISSWPAGGNPRRKTTHPSFVNGFHFVLNGISIPVYPHLIKF